MLGPRGALSLLTRRFLSDLNNARGRSGRLWCRRCWFAAVLTCDEMPVVEMQTNMACDVCSYMLVCVWCCKRRCYGVGRVGVVTQGDARIMCGDTGLGVVVLQARTLW